MKHNWTYKKLGEIATYVNGFAFKPSDWKSQGLPIIRIQNLNDPSAEYNFYDKEIAPKYIVNDGDILISWSASLGVYEWQRGKAVLNQHIFKVVFDKSDIDKHYLKYCVEAKLTDMSRLAHGATMRHVVKGDFDNTLIPYPSLDVQQAIVRELDGINRLIDLQEEQLREYDRLAQSLFYTTFGDPTTNPKGWDVKKLGEILSYIKNGANIKQTRGAGGLPITRIETLSGGVFNRDRLGYADITDLLKYANFYLETGDLLMSHINSKTYIGRTVMYEKEGDETIIHGMNLLRLKVVRDIVNPVYVCYYCKTDRFKGDVAKIRKDAVNQSSICISDIVRISLPLPPLALQQTFAAQIEAIEQQKALIRRSLDEIRTLLAARMQYYFE